MNYNHKFSNIHKLRLHNTSKFFDLKLLKALKYTSWGNNSIPHYETCNALMEKELCFKLTHNDRMTFVLVLLRKKAFVLVLLRKKATKNGIIDLFFTLINQKILMLKKMFCSLVVAEKCMIHTKCVPKNGALILSSHKQYTQQTYNSFFSQKKHIQLIQWLACVKWLDTNKTDGKLRKYY